MHKCWKRFDLRFMQPWFGHTKPAAVHETEMSTRRGSGSGAGAGAGVGVGGRGRRTRSAHGDYTQVDDDRGVSPSFASPLPSESKGLPSSAPPRWGTGAVSVGTASASYAPPAEEIGADLGAGSGDFFGGRDPPQMSEAGL